MTRYRDLADEVATLITSGTLRTGERVPSVRDLVRQHRVSPATAMRAYEVLESKELIEARPRSGYYVSDRWHRQISPPRHSRPPSKSTSVAISELVFDILESTRHRDIVPLGSAFPSPILFPWAKLARFLGSSARHMDPWDVVQSLPPGSDELRRQIARRYLLSGASVSTEEIIVTSGALEALNLALAALTRPGDIVAIESPTFYACLQALEAAGLKALEIPTHPVHGVNVGALEEAIRKHDVRACWFMTSFQNPTGATMPDDSKRELVRLLAQHEIPLIEDDVYAELYFGDERPRAAKSYDTQGLVLNCGSFSKSLAPGYRLGWVAAGRFAKQIERRKIISTLATSMPIQEGIASMLRHGVDQHLDTLRAALQRQQAQMLESIKRHFPAGYRLAAPQGGYFLWVELPAHVDAMALREAALRADISIAPGPMFSARRAFRNCVRINCGHPFTPTLERAIAELGRLATTPSNARK